MASRKASQIALEAFTAALPELLGGSADLTGSNLTNTKARRRCASTPAAMSIKSAEGQIGRHINYGVREFGMAAIMNGVALHGGYIPYGGTFLTFSDYSRNAIRMAALMKKRVIHVFTHDSHRPGRRRPDAPVGRACGQPAADPEPGRLAPGRHGRDGGGLGGRAAERQRPTALLLTRRTCRYAPKTDLDEIARGGYVLAEPSEWAQQVATRPGRADRDRLRSAAGSAAQKIWPSHRIVACAWSRCRARPPSTARIDAYKQRVLPSGLPRIAIEAGSTDFWWKYGCAAVVGIDSFGESAPAPALFQHFGFTPDNVADTVRAVLARQQAAPSRK